MLNLVSLCVGGIALFWAMLAFLPLFGWMYWFILPFALFGLALGALSRRSAGRTLNLIVLAVGLMRLMIGGGLV
ncbi:hypothetical protein [Sphingomonas morindae]|uniref:Transmembrane protein n=1 Tax=Sphingomonas morindae TaxID=1541170 RepID=A0ABY4XBC5_9SPHN|nr:hypothetical protein [Sphingomonas morindae]USI74174.1 hypothetical protein LHA26_06900 [Sphingomonas morindae]